MKQTAVEYLIEQLSNYDSEMIKLFEKEMEKQQRGYSEEELKKNCKHNWIRENDSFNLKPYCKKCGIDY